MPEPDASLTEASTLSIRTAVGRSLALLAPRERRRYRLVVGAQMATSILDLVGVLLIGMVGLLAASSVQGTEVPNQVAVVAGAVGLGNLSAESLTGLLAVAAAAFLLLKSAVYGVLMHRIYRFLGESQAEVTSRFTRSVMYQTLPALESTSSQETAYALTSGATAAFIGVLGALSIILAEVALLVLLGAALVVINPLVTVVAIVFLASIGFAVQRGLSAWSRRLGDAVGESSIASYEAVQESIASHREMFVTDRRDLAIQRISSLLARLSVSISDGYFASQIPKLAYESALVVGAIGLASWQLLTTDRITAVTTLALFLAAGSRIVPSMLRVSVQSASIAGAVGQAKSTYELAERLSTVSVGSPPGTASVSAKALELSARIVTGYAGFEARLQVEDVSYTYPGAATPAVTDVVLLVEPGSSMALVGSTGAGKSTAADLMLGILTPSRGSVQISGAAPIDAISRWPGAIGYVPQHVTLENATIRENIALGFERGQTDDDLVWDALDQAQLADFLVGFREGLDTLIGERGAKLSGGQRQRLGLARALYSRPKLLVLDEATSALDAETEAAITQTMRRLSGSVTTITVAHRLATVQDADQVVFLNLGRVEAVGTFDEVRRAIPQFDRQANLLGL